MFVRPAAGVFCFCLVVQLVGIYCTLVRPAIIMVMKSCLLDGHFFYKQLAFRNAQTQCKKLHKQNRTLKETYILSFWFNFYKVTYITIVKHIPILFPCLHHHVNFMF